MALKRDRITTMIKGTDTLRSQDSPPGRTKLTNNKTTRGEGSIITRIVTEKSEMLIIKEKMTRISQSQTEWSRI